MSTKPSWLDDEESQTAAVKTVGKVAQNPIAQKVAKDVAQDPKVQAAVKDAFLSAATDAATPAWAKDSYAPPAVAGIPVAEATTSRDTVSNPDPNSGKEFECDPEVLRDMKRWHLYLRLLYMLAACFLGLAGGLILAAAPSITQFFFCFYVMFFALILCCFEIGLDSVGRLIAVNFGFLYTIPGRLGFLLFVGFMSYSLALVGKLAMGFLYFVYCVHIFIYFKFPKFEEYLRKMHYFSRPK